MNTFIEGMIMLRGKLNISHTQNIYLFSIDFDEKDYIKAQLISKDIMTKCSIENIMDIKHPNSVVNWDIINQLMVDIAKERLY